MANYDNKEEINQFVGILDDGSYMFVDYFFESGDLHGATATALRPVSKEYVEERIEELKDYEWSPIAHIYDEQNTEESWDEWIAGWGERELEDLVTDPSGGQYWDKAREVCEYHEGFEFYTTDCHAGGRLFSSAPEADPTRYDYLENVELLKNANKAERGDYFDN